MDHSPHKIVIVIPTIGRHAELSRMLASLAQQTRLPDEVIIVDEDESSWTLAGQFPRLKIRVKALPGSASAKRNAGLKAAPPNMTLIGFMDDDIVLDDAAVSAMAAFWEQAPAAVGGTTCNYLNAPRGFAPGLKKLPLWSALGLYEARPGSVAKSGFQTRVTDLHETTYVRWLPSGATFYTREVLEKFCFDEWFAGYSYLEDLDFSYRIGKKYKLAVVAESHFYHYPSPIGRVDPYGFGIKEVTNRLHFVRKHAELSTVQCCITLSIRALMSMLWGLTCFEAAPLKRAGGNVIALLSALTSQ